MTRIKEPCCAICYERGYQDGFAEGIKHTKGDVTQCNRCRGEAFVFCGWSIKQGGRICTLPKGHTGFHDDAGVAEVADAADLKSANHVGSNPAARTIDMLRLRKEIDPDAPDVVVIEGDPEFSLADLNLWFRRVLDERLKYRSTTRSDQPVGSGYTYAEIPEWELRQKWDLVTQAINGVNALVNQAFADGEHMGGETALRRARIGAKLGVGEVLSDEAEEARKKWEHFMTLHCRECGEDADEHSTD